MKKVWAFNSSRITACRELLGLSPERLARQIGVTGQTVRNWEHGLSTPCGDDLATLATVFQMTPHGFFSLMQKGAGRG